MTINYGSKEFASSVYTSARRPYTTPVLEELLPGTARYEAAKAALAQIARGGGQRTD
jgi:hypothetical protein